MQELSAVGGRQSRVWLWVLVGGLALVALYFIFPNRVVDDAIYSALGIGSVVAILAGVRLNRPKARRGWLFVAGSGAAFAAGDILSNFSSAAFHQAANAVSYADVLYLAGYPLLFFGVIRITRQRPREQWREDRADAVIVALGAFALLWQFLMAPYVHDAAANNLEKLVNLAYPVMDVVLVYIVVQTLLFSRTQGVYLRIVAAAMMTMFASDLVYDLLVLHGRYTSGNGVAALFLIEYVLMGVAALHPSTADGVPLDAFGMRNDRRLRSRTPTVVVASLTPPVMLIVASLLGLPVSVPVIATVCVAVFVLTGLRLAWLINRIGRQTMQLEKNLRELKDSYRQRDDLEANLWHQALHDPLTGLANRALLEDRLALARARVARQGAMAAVLMLDLDDFKDVNDTQGHLVGDQLLVAISRRLAAVTRSSDTLCRFGGDEFVYLAEGLQSRAEIEELGNRLLGQFVEPFAVGDLSFEQHASIGIAICDAEVDVDADFIRDADAAMYMAKGLRAGNYVVFTSGMREKAVSDFSLVQELRSALHRNELSMHYQPIIELQTMEIVGFEALMRWRHPERGLVPPDVFIPLAEKSDLIFDLGRFALREALSTAATWDYPTTRSRGPFVAVNLSARQFHDPDILELVKSLFVEQGYAPGLLVIEVTEHTALLDTADTMDVIARLANFGVDLALDDFGTGYSSLSHLTMLRPAYLKVDQSFISPITPSKENDTLLEAIVSLGHKLTVSVLAEGVETRAQLQKLRALGCEFAQGFLLSPALPADELEGLFTRSFEVEA